MQQHSEVPITESIAEEQKVRLATDHRERRRYRMLRGHHVREGVNVVLFGDEEISRCRRDVRASMHFVNDGMIKRIGEEDFFDRYLLKFFLTGAAPQHHPGYIRPPDRIYHQMK